MQLEIDAIEKLLFPLNKNVYKSIQDELNKLSNEDIQNIINCFNFEKESYFHEPLKGTDKLSKFPEFNINLSFDENEDYTENSIVNAKKYKICSSNLRYIERSESMELPTSDLIILFYHHHIENYFIIPLAYILGLNLKKIKTPGYYQVYQHMITPKSIIQNRDYYISISRGQIDMQKEINENSYIYIGITKRSWQKRYQEHINSSRSNSYLRFHRCLRQDFFEIGAIEHIIDRAGITEDEAMLIEEKNVEQMSLYPLFPRGLNMIPGGKAGLKFLHEHARRIGYKIERKIDADIFESELLKMEDFNLKQIQKNQGEKVKNEKLAELWANDINFRIKAITNQNHHFSYEQIQCARLLFSSGWDLEKILENIKKLNTEKDININQLNNLLNGDTYSSIPYVLL